MTLKEKKDLAVKAITQLKGDDLIRANNAFGELTEEELGKTYWHSGKTCRQVWSEYKKKAKECDETIKWIKSLK